MTAPRWRLRLIRRSLIGLLTIALVAAFFVTLPAQAATVLGSLSFSPAKSTSAEPITLRTVSTGATKGCAAPADSVAGVMTGPGGWKDGITVVTIHSADVSLTEDFSIPMDDTLGGIAVSNGVQIEAGKYTVTIYCADELGFTRYGEFSAPLWFTDATHFSHVFKREYGHSPREARRSRRADRPGPAVHGSTRN